MDRSRYDSYTVFILVIILDRYTTSRGLFGVSTAVTSCGASLPKESDVQVREAV